MEKETNEKMKEYEFIEKNIDDETEKEMVKLNLEKIEL